MENWADGQQQFLAMLSTLTTHNLKRFRVLTAKAACATCRDLWPVLLLLSLLRSQLPGTSNIETARHGGPVLRTRYRKLEQLSRRAKCKEIGYKMDFFITIDANNMASVCGVTAPIKQAPATAAAGLQSCAPYCSRHWHRYSNGFSQHDVNFRLVVPPPQPDLPLQEQSPETAWGPAACAVPARCTLPHYAARNFQTICGVLLPLWWRRCGQSLSAKSVRRKSD